MTTFEIITIVLLAIIAVTVIWLCLHIKKALFYGTNCILDKLSFCDSKLGYIKSIAMNIQSNTGDTVAWQKANNEMLQEAHKRLCELNILLADIANNVAIIEADIREKEDKK